MGCRQSQPITSPLEKQHAEKRKRVSNNLEKSREKYLSAILMSSNENLLNLEDVPNTRGEGQNNVKGENMANNGLKPGTGYGSQESEAEAEAPLADSEDTEDSHSSDSDAEEKITKSVRPSILRSRQRRKTRQTVKPRIIPKGRTSFHPLGRYDRSSSFHDDVDRQAAKTNPFDYTYFFENLVFEGGGNKGLAYCGAVRYLEELGVMNKVKRFSGASAGAMVAGLLAVGYNSYEIEQFLSDRIDHIFLDASCGYLSLLPNLVRSFGWNPGRRIYDWFGDKLKEKTGDADFTFHQLYQKKGTILCIIVTNLSQMTTEYCHPKTTPDMPIRMALRMSMAIPGLFSAMKYKRLGVEDVYVDGGVLCNYPVHCFDGWYLSMDPKHSFLRQLQPLRDIPIIMERHNRFGSFNDRTLGMLLYSDAEEDILRINLERRVGCLKPAKPDPETKLFMQREKEAKQKRRAEREYAQVVQAVDSFLRVLKKHNMDDNDVINRQELEAAFKDEEEFPRYQAEVLFGKDFTVSEAFQLLDRDDNGQIRYEELLRFIEENGVCLQSRFLGYQRREITNFVSFLNTLTSTLTFNVQKLYVEERDLERTVGINTGHIHTTDFNLESPDREFVVLRGYNSMKAFLTYFVVLKPDKVIPRSQDKSLFPDIEEDVVTPTPGSNSDPDPDPDPDPDSQSSTTRAYGNPHYLAIPEDGGQGTLASKEMAEDGVQDSSSKPSMSLKCEEVDGAVQKHKGHLEVLKVR